MPREGLACTQDDSVSLPNLAFASKASPFLEVHAVLKPKSLLPNTVPVTDVLYHFFCFLLKHLLVHSFQYSEYLSLKQQQCWEENIK